MNNEIKEILEEIKEKKIIEENKILKEQQEEIQKLKNNWNKLEKWLEEEIEKLHNISGENFITVGQAIYKEVLKKTKELKKEG